MSENLHNHPESIVFSGIIGEVIHETQPGGQIFERYRRPPGTRIIIISPDNKILITKEHRTETGNIDYRLPGGKVRDSLDEYHELLKSNKPMEVAAKEAAIKEAAEETGFDVIDPELVTISKAGATVEWDLYYFVATNYKEIESGQTLEHGENIEVSWMDFEDIEEAIASGRMQEWRSVGVLLGIVLPRLKSS